jgi:hypothetical protein
MFADQVKSGALPPVDKRIPEAPSIVKQFAGADGPGRYGGQINMLMANARDTRMMTLYANARLIVYDDHFKLQPDILESYEAKDSREFTLKLRPRPQMVGRRALHRRGLPLLLGRRRQQQGAVARRTECRADGRRQAARRSRSSIR